MFWDQKPLRVTVSQTTRNPGNPVCFASIIENCCKWKCLQAKYHEDFEKNIKGSKIQVADDPETQRLKQLNAIVSQVEYKGLKEKVNEMETHRQSAAAQGKNCHDVQPIRTHVRTV